MKLESPDIIVLILTGTIAIILISAIMGATISGKQITEWGAEILGDLSMALVAIISMYIGNRMKK